MGQRRARQIHEKESRRQDILAAASRLFEERTFGGLSMAQIAAESGLAKGTPYLYFPTKEELFLALAEAELLGCFEELDEGLGKRRKPIGTAELADLLARSLVSRPRLPRLLALLPGTLEHNIGHLTALRFRRFLATRLLRTGRILERRLDFLEAGQGTRLLFKVLALALGTWPLADPAPRVREILSAPGMDLFRMDFAEELRSGLADLLAGMEARAAVPAGLGSD